MNKKTFLIPVLLIGLTLATLPTMDTASASSNDPIIIEGGKISNGRILMPLRSISEAFGSKVDWNQKTKTVTINDGQKETVLVANSTMITVNGKPVTIDAPAQIESGVTFAPLVVSSPTGSEVEWDNKKKQATITLDDKIVIATLSKVESQQISNSQMLVFIKKADEIANLKSIKQVRTHFNPYFTGSFINAILSKDRVYGIEHSNKFKHAKSKAYVIYWDNGSATIYQTAPNPLDPLNEKTYYNRAMTVIKTNGVWKVDSMSIYLTRDDGHDGQMNG